MNSSALKDYLDAIVKMETICYTDRYILNEFKTACDSIGTPFTFLMPVMPEERKPLTIPITVCGLIAAAAFFFLSISRDIFALSKRYYCAILGVVALLCTLLALWHDKKKCALAQKEQEEYQFKLRQYNEGIEKDKLRVQQEQAKKYIFIRDRELLSARYSLDTELLEKLYDLDIIFPKYRNFIMVSALHEYIHTGRCERLEGVDGGYAALEHDISTGRICTDISKLELSPDDASHSQYTVYHVITSASEISKRIVAEERRIVSEFSSAADNKSAVEGNKYLSSYCRKTAQECDSLKLSTDSLAVNA